MVAILFLVKFERQSQIAYKMLMQTSIEFKPFDVRGKNVIDKLKILGITKVPTLYIPKTKQRFEGVDDIQILIDKVKVAQKNRDVEKRMEEEEEENFSSSEGEKSPKIARIEDESPEVPKRRKPSKEEDSPHVTKKRAPKRPVKKQQEETFSSSSDSIKHDDDDEQELTI